MPGAPAPYSRGRSESLSDHVRDLANAFSSAAGVLSDQYTTLNQATNGLLDGTNPWEGMGATNFSTAWQAFGTYIQQIQKACQDIYNSLNKFANTLSDLEAQQVWDIILSIVGGILTIISFLAAIAEFGLNPFVDGFTAFIGTFTEQEGTSVVNTAEEVTQADSQAAEELQTVETELTTSPILTGPTGETPGSIPDVVSEASLDDMTLTALDDSSNMTSKQWRQWIEENTFDYNTDKSLDGINAPNACAPSTVKMLLNDNGITATDQQIEDAIGYNPANGTTINQSADNQLTQGLRKLGLPNATYTPNMTMNELEDATAAGKPVIVGVNLGTNPNAPNEMHTVIVDGVEDTPLGEMVLIRDPFFTPTRAYMLPMRAFQQIWRYGGGWTY